MFSILTRACKRSGDGVSRHRVHRKQIVLLCALTLLCISIIIIIQRAILQHICAHVECDSVMLVDVWRMRQFKPALETYALPEQMKRIGVPDLTTDPDWQLRKWRLEHDQLKQQVLYTWFFCSWTLSRRLASSTVLIKSPLCTCVMLVCGYGAMRKRTVI